MILRRLCQHLEAIAPLELSADWDNTGLLAGDPQAEVRRVLLAVDLTDAVLAEAINVSAHLAVCYHPPIFAPLRRVLAGESSPGRRVFEAIRSGLALYATHTALDAAVGGTNDVLAEALGLRDVRPLAPHSSLDDAVQRGGVSPPAGRCKLVTFVPPDAVERVAEALFAAGAGRIGDYAKCSFRVVGTGTFLGGEGTVPAVGQAGRFETVEEVRIEAVLPAGRAAEAVAALRRAHPYEEAAFDLYPLATLDERVGLGRIGQLAQPATLEELVGRIKRALNIAAVWVAAPARADGAAISVAACAAGSCGELFRSAIAAGAGLYLTGELRHHDALEAAAAGLAVVVVGHWVSERPVLARLAEQIRRAAPELDVRLSQADAAPFRWA